MRKNDGENTHRKWVNCLGECTWENLEATGCVYFLLPSIFLLQWTVCPVGTSCQSSDHCQHWFPLNVSSGFGLLPCFTNYLWIYLVYRGEHVCVWEGECHMQTRHSENGSWESAPSFYHVDHRNQTQVVRTDVGSLFLLSHHLLPTPFLEGAFLRKAVERALLRLPMSENSYSSLRTVTEV